MKKILIITILLLVTGCVQNERACFASKSLKACEAMANAGDPRALEVLGYKYRIGKDVQQNNELSEQYYGKAREVFERKASEGDIISQRELFYAYIGMPHHKYLVQPDKQKAHYWLSVIDRSGQNPKDTIIMRAIAGMYEQGRYISKDNVQAYKWAILGFNGNDVGAASACASRNRIAKQMTAEQIAEAKRQAMELQEKWGKSSKDKCMFYNRLDH